MGDIFQKQDFHGVQKCLGKKLWGGYSKWEN